MSKEEELKTLKDMGIFMPLRDTPLSGIEWKPVNNKEGWVKYSDLKQEAIKWIKKLKKFKEISEEREKTEDEYHKENPEDYHTDKYYKTCVNHFQKQERELDEEFKKLGIEFACADYGEKDYCLSPNGLIITIKILYNVSEEDLK